MLITVIILSSISSFSCGKQVNTTDTSKIAKLTTTLIQPDNEESATTIKKTSTSELTKKEDKNIFEVGDIINFGDLEFCVNGITNKKGSKSIFIEVSIKNNGNIDREISSLLMFGLQDEFQRSQTINLIVPPKGNVDGVIPPGKTLVGELPYIVQEEVKAYKL